MHGASFLGVYVCVRAHAHTHTYAQFTDGGQKTALRSHFSPIMVVPGSSSDGQYCCYAFTHQAVLLAHLHFFVNYALGVMADHSLFCFVFLCV